MNRLTLPERSPASSEMVSRWTKGLSRARTEEERSTHPPQVEPRSIEGKCCLRSSQGTGILRSWSDTETPCKVSYSLCSYLTHTRRPRPMDPERNPPMRMAPMCYRPGPGLNSFGRGLVAMVGRTYSSSDKRNPFLPQFFLYSAHPNDVDLLIFG